MLVEYLGEMPFMIGEYLGYMPFILVIYSCDISYMLVENLGDIHFVLVEYSRRIILSIYSVLILSQCNLHSKLPISLRNFLK